MCLEFLNQFLRSGLAWWALGIFVALIAALAALFILLPARQKNPACPTGGFTCPCYAPPASPAKDRASQPDSA